VAQRRERVGVVRRASGTDEPAGEVVDVEVVEPAGQAEQPGTEDGERRADRRERGEDERFGDRIGASSAARSL
jgi:hypothetical protein